MCRWLLLVVLAGLAPGTRGADSELTAEEVVRQHLEALGGRARIASIKSLTKRGSYAYNGLEYPIVSYQKAGRRSREEIEGLQLWGTSVREDHTVVRGSNGTVAWVEDESRPPERRPIPPPRAALMLEEADLQGPLLDYRAKGHRVELVGTRNLEGVHAHQLRVTLASGLVQSWYLGLESHLVLRIEVEAEEDRDLERPWAWQYDDYRPVDGVLMPFWVYVEEPLFAREYLFESIEANHEIDDALFEPPPGATTQSPN